MMRTLVERLALFAVPFALYGLYLVWAKLFPPRQARAHPWMALTIAGLVLVALSFLIWRATSVEPITGIYVAPHMVNGKVVPGYVEPPETRK
ncbi:MAG: DUF6111 family protein [Rhizomicrobium sp.]